MRIKALLVAALTALAFSLWPVKAQIGSTVTFGSALPGTCSVGSMYVVADGSGFHVCTATNTWTRLAWASAAVPAGGIVFVSSGSCPSGYTQVAGLDGKMIRGTLAANGDVGGTGGSDSVTPTFTGTAWSAPAVSWPVGVPTFTGTAGTVPAQTFTGSSATTSAVSGGTPAGTNGASATSGNCAATNIAAGTGSTTACKATAPNLTVSAQTFTGSALGTHQHTLTATGTNGTAAFTPAGTIAWPAGVPTLASYTPTGTIGAVDNRPAYIKLIGCSKD